MKTIEEKAKAYDEAIKVAKSNYEAIVQMDNDCTFAKEGIVNTFHHMFPELAESEDERIRKAIRLILIATEDDQKDFYETHKLTRKKLTDWLEKQGEQKLIDKIQIGKKYKCIASPRYSTFMKGCIYQPEDKFLCSLMNFCSDCFEPVEEVELNLAEKVEPKFKVGDWLINPRTSHIIHIKDVLICDNKGIYELENSSMSIKNVEDNFRLWTIQDAKDGDVLASNLERKNGISPFIAIYKNRGLDFFTSYCFIGLDGKFYKGDTGHDIIGIHPATKEQRDLLFQKMKEAGYEWDAEKKELKKIIAPIFHIGDRVRYKGHACDGVITEITNTDYICGNAKLPISTQDKLELVEQKLAWSEEDGEIFEEVCSSIKYAEKHRITCSEKLAKLQLDWFKSLKNRVLPQPKQE